MGRQPSAVLGIIRLTWQIHLLTVVICSTKCFKCTLREFPFHAYCLDAAAGQELFGYHLLMAAVGCSDERVEERDQLKVRLVETLIC